MQLVEAQNVVDAWIKAHGDYWNEFVILARLIEELGEISKALQILRNYRSKWNIDPKETDLEGELGDLFFTLCAFANKSGINLEKAFNIAIKKYNLRDSQK